jgi:hypothetical protein
MYNIKYYFYFKKIYYVSLYLKIVEILMFYKNVLILVTSLDFAGAQ